MGRRRTAAEWRQIVDGWTASGRPKSQYARSVGVHPSTLGWWRWRLRPSERAPSGFAEVVVAEAEPMGVGRVPDFVVELEDLRVRVSPGFDAPELRRLLAALC